MFALAEHMNRQNAVMISYEALEFLTGYARATLSKAIRMLEEERNGSKLLRLVMLMLISLIQERFGNPTEPQIH